MSTTLPTDSNARKEYPLFRGPFRYFPAALAGIARICKIGNDKHNPGQEMHHARGKSNDHADCVLRHLLDLGEDFGQGVGRDENGVPQVDYLAWRACALAQEWHELNDGAPLAPGAKLPSAPPDPFERRSGPISRRHTSCGDPSYGRRTSHGRRIGDHEHARKLPG